MLKSESAAAGLAASVARWASRGAAMLFLAAVCSSQATAAATDTLDFLRVSNGPLQSSADAFVDLAVVRKANGAPLSAQIVDWTVSESEGTTLLPARSKTSSGSDVRGAGIARTRFKARAGGRYVVTATSQVNPGCSGEDCAQFVRDTMEIEVAPPLQAASETATGSHRLLSAVAVVAGAALLVANNRRDENQVTDRALAIQGGNGQSGPPNSALPAPLTVLVTNDGQPAAGVTIAWTASGGATLSSGSSTSNSSGIASISVASLGPGPGPVAVTASRTDGAASVQFSLTVLQPALAIVSGNGQSAPTGTQIPLPLVVRASIGPTAQAGIGITWVVTGGDATVSSVSNAGVTDSSGQSSAVIQLGSTPGTVVVSARRADAPTIAQTFTINATLVRSLDIASGDGQTAAPNSPYSAPLVVTARDNGNPATGITINWFASGGASLSATSSVTDGAGNASVSVVNSGPGPDPIQVTATRADAPTASVLFDGNIVPPVLTVSGGNGQSGLTGSAAASPLQVLLVDGGGSPVAGQLISWVVTSGSAALTSGNSVTDAAGHASMTFQYGLNPGPVTIEASAYGGDLSVEFNATTLAGTVTASSGDGQTGNPGDTLAPFVITIVAPPGATDLSGVPVTFNILSGTGTLSVTNTVTDANGQASTVLTLGLTPGAVSVRAQVAGGGSTTFTATIAGSLVATTLSIISGDGQTLSVGVPSQAMTVELRDSGAPLPGKQISWSSNNGSVSSSTSTTDASGRASVTVTPSGAGAIIVTASFAAVAQYTASSVSFSHNGSISSIAGLPTDAASVAVALDNACVSLDASSNLTPEEQDLLNQCLALAAASSSSPAAVVDAIEELLPDVAETQAQTGQTAVGAQFDNLKGRMATLRAGSVGSSFGGLALVGSGGRIPLAGLVQSLFADETPAAPKNDGFSRWGFFGSGTIGRGEGNPRDSTPNYDFDINGLTLGVDYRQSDQLILGAAIGYTKQDTTLAHGEGEVDMHGFSASGYASWYLQDSWYLDSVLTLGHNSFKHRRRILYSLPGSVTVDQQARASSDGRDTSFAATFGRDFHKDAWGFGGYGRVLYSKLHFDAFEEELTAGLAGSGLGLRVDSRSVTALSSVLGGKVTYTHSTSWGVVVPHGQLEWQHEYRSDPELFRAFLIDDPTGTPILVSGEAQDSSYFRLGLGMSLVMTHGRSGFILYERLAGREGISQDTLSMGFRIEF